MEEANRDTQPKRNRAWILRAKRDDQAYCHARDNGHDWAIGASQYCCHAKTHVQAPLWRTITSEHLANLATFADPDRVHGSKGLALSLAQRV